MIWVLGFILSFVASSLQGASYVWPTQDWKTSSLQAAGVDAQRFEEFLSYTFPENLDWESREGIRTEGLVVIKEGLLIYERYARGYGAQKRHRAWSVSKFLLNALTGVAIKRKILSLDDSVSKFLPESEQEKFQTVKVRDLLSWSSGLEWSETYEYNPLASSVIAMLYSVGAHNMARFVMDLPLSDSPGKEFRYSSGDSNLLMHVLRQALSKKEYENFPWASIFDPLGMKSATLERDPEGLFVASSYLHVTARDLAKLGLLYLNDGVWNKNRILPEGWVFKSSRIVPSYRQTEADRHLKHLSPGLQIWVNREEPQRGISKPLADVPSDMIAGLGHWGQAIFMIPSERIIVVRFADDRDLSFDANRFLKLLLDSQ